MHVHRSDFNPVAHQQKKVLKGMQIKSGNKRSHPYYVHVVQKTYCLKHLYHKQAIIHIDFHTLLQHPHKQQC